MFKKLKKILNYSGILDEFPFTKGISSFIFLSFIFFLLVRGNKVLFDKDYLLFVILLEVFLAGVILKSFSGYWFEKLWILGKGFMKEKWIKMNKIKLRFRHGVAFFGTSVLAFFHIFQYFILRNDYSYLAYEQLSIGLMFLLLFGWFVFQGSSTIENPKKIAFTIFLMGIFMVVFDFILGQLQYIFLDSGWVSNILFSLFMPFALLIYLFFPESSLL
ncbi:MAG: hypothetical protein AABX28_01460 [Nanoarchaeota archaeon]